MRVVFFLLGLAQVLVLFGSVIALAVLAVRGLVRAVLRVLHQEPSPPPPAKTPPVELARATVPAPVRRRFIP
jgi:hypothetical protein